MHICMYMCPYVFMCKHIQTKSKSKSEEFLPDLFPDCSHNAEGDRGQKKWKQESISMLMDAPLAHKDSVETDEVKSKAIKPQGKAKTGIKPIGP